MNENKKPAKEEKIDQRLLDKANQIMEELLIDFLVAIQSTAL